MGSGVSESHERRSIKFRLRHSGVSSLQESCRFARPQSESVSVFARRRLPPSPTSSISVFARLLLRLSPSSPVSDFVYLRLRPSPTSSISVFARLRLRPSPTSSISVFVRLRRNARWLVQRVSAIKSDVLYRGSGNYLGVRVLSLYGTP